MMLLWFQIKAKKVKNIIEIYAKMRPEYKCGNMPCSVNAHVGMTIKPPEYLRNAAFKAFTHWKRPCDYFVQ